MRAVSSFAPLVGLALLGSSASAQISEVLLVETTHDQLVRLVDTNGDSQFLDLGELTTFFSVDGGTGTNASSPRNAQMTVEGGQPVVYWVDTTLDQVLRAEDVNGNGTIDLGEETAWRDSASLDGASSPDSLDIFPDGSVWWTSDGSAHQGVFRCEDLNADGDANDAGEQIIYILDGSPITVEFDGGSGQAPEAGVTYNDFFQVCPGGGSAAIVWSRGNSAAFRLEDKNSDGDVLDAGEIRLFCNPGQDNPNLPQNADWASGVLRTLEVNDGGAPATTLGWAWLDHWVHTTEGGADVWYFATGTSSSSSFAFNINGDGNWGLIYRGEDLNLDGDIQDAGEVTLWYDGSNTGIATTFGKVIGFDIGSDGLYVGDLFANVPAVHRLRDLNADGDADDAGEQDLGLFDYTNFSAGTEKPFTIGSPFTYDICVLDAGLWNPPPSPGFTTSGTGCSGFGPVPNISAQGQAKIGTANLNVQVTNTIGGTIAALSIGYSTTSWFGVPLPADLGALLGDPSLAGCNLYQNNALNLKVTTTGVGQTGGVGQVNVFIPNDPNLVGVKLPMQWVVVDLFTTLRLAFTGLGEAEIAL